jgi:hypothetical protein
MNVKEYQKNYWKFYKYYRAYKKKLESLQCDDELLRLEKNLSYKDFLQKFKMPNIKIINEKYEWFRKYCTCENLQEKLKFKYGIAL